MTSRAVASQDRYSTSATVFRGSAALFAVVLFFGGGGAPNPLAHAALEAVSFAWLLFLTWVALFRRPVPREALFCSVFILAMLALLAVQLVPLPYSVWSALPGRQLAVAAIAAAGLGEPAMPLSLDPEQTRVSALMLIPAIAICFSTYMLAADERQLLIRIPIAVALASALIGALQFSMPGTAVLYIHQKTYFDLPSGIFANRNSQADFLLVGILLCALQLRLGEFKKSLTSRRLQLAPFDVVCAAAIPFLALMALATLSRFGALLLGPVLLAAFVIAWRPSLKRAITAAGSLALLAVALTFLAPGLLEELRLRFLEGGSRTELLPDSIYAADTVFPVGSGLGTFGPLFRSGEGLASLTANYVNHAHNDYLEIAIEAGLAGLILTALFVLAFLYRAARVWLNGAERSYVWIQRAASLGMAVMLVHSLVDYPLRTMTLQALFAYFAAFLFSTPPRAAERRQR
jgi:exopolysaccharide production protein ExoQ